MSEHYIEDFGIADQAQVWVGHTTDCTEPDPGMPEPGGPSLTRTEQTSTRCRSARNQTYTRLEPRRPKQQQQQQQRRQQQQAAAAAEPSGASPHTLQARIMMEPALHCDSG